MRGILLFTVIMGSLLFILRFPYLGLLEWSFLSYNSPHRFTWGFARTFPFVQYVAILTLVSVLFSKDRKSIPVTGVTTVLVLFTLWAGVVTYTALFRVDAMVEWERFMKIQAMIFVTLMLANTRQRLHLLAWCIVLACGYYGLRGGVFVITRLGRWSPTGPPDSFFFDNNALALVLLMVMPLMWYLHEQYDDKWVKRGLKLLMFLTFVSIVGSYSRGAMLTVVGMSGLVWLRSRQKSGTLLAILLIAPLLVMLMPQKWLDRMETLQHYQQGNVGGSRLHSWKFAISLTRDRPIVGGGFRCFNEPAFKRWAENPEEVHDAHSIYFEVLGEMGYVGLGLFLLLHFLTFRTGSWIRSRTRGSPQHKWAFELATALQFGQVAYLIGGAGLGLAYFDLPYHLIVMLVLLKVRVSEEIAAPQAAAATDESAPAPRPPPVPDYLQPRPGTGAGHTRTR